MSQNSVAASYTQGLLLAYLVGFLNLSSEDLLTGLLKQKDNFGM